MAACDQAICIIIDTNIARSAGEASDTNGSSTACRVFLETMRDEGLSTAQSPAAKEERDRHAGRFFRKWSREMFARKLFARVNPADNPTLEAKLLATVASPHDQEEMRKDFFLIHDALATDRRVASLDENTARRLFQIAAKSVSEIRDICWVNPERAEEEPVEWLKVGAPFDLKRLLGS